MHLYYNIFCATKRKRLNRTEHTRTHSWTHKKWIQTDRVQASKQFHSFQFVAYNFQLEHVTKNLVYYDYVRAIMYTMDSFYSIASDNTSSIPSIITESTFTYDSKREKILLYSDQRLKSQKICTAVQWMILTVWLMAGKWCLLLRGNSVELQVKWSGKTPLVRGR